MTSPWHKPEVDTIRTNTALHLDSVNKYLSIAGVAFFVAILALASGCFFSGKPEEQESGMDIVFLMSSTCQNTSVVRERLLGAIASLDFEVNLKSIDVGSLPPDDYRTGYGTPTILVAGDDLFGVPRPESATPI